MFIILRWRGVTVVGLLPHPRDVIVVCVGSMEVMGPRFAPDVVWAVRSMNKLEVVASRGLREKGDVWLGVLWVGYAWRVVPLGGGRRLFPLVGTRLKFHGL